MQQFDIRQVDCQLLPAALEDVRHFLISSFGVGRMAYLGFHSFVIDGNGRSFLPHRPFHSLHQLSAAHVRNQQANEGQLQCLHDAVGLDVLDGKRFESQQQLKPSEVVNALEGCAVVVERLALSRPAVFLWLVLLFLHALIDLLRDCAEFLSLKEGRGTHEIAVEQHSEVIDCVLEVAVGEFRNAGERGSCFGAVRMVLPKRVAELLGCRGRAADLGADAQVLDLCRSQ